MGYLDDKGLQHLVEKLDKNPGSSEGGSYMPLNGTDILDGSEFLLMVGDEEGENGTLLQLNQTDASLVCVGSTGNTALMLIPNAFVINTSGILGEQSVTVTGSGVEISKVVEPTSDDMPTPKSYVDAVTGLSKSVYSTEEQRIGTWIDGKPLYRKVYVGKSYFGQNTAAKITIDSDFRTTKTHIRSYGGMKVPYSATNIYEYNLPGAANTHYMWLGVVNTGELRLEILWDSPGNGEYWVAAECTKLEDAATISIPMSSEQNSLQYSSSASSADATF